MLAGWDPEFCGALDVPDSLWVSDLLCGFPSGLS